MILLGINYICVGHKSASCFQAAICAAILSEIVSVALLIPSLWTATIYQETQECLYSPEVEGQNFYMYYYYLMNIH